MQCVESHWLKSLQVSCLESLQQDRGASLAQRVLIAALLCWLIAPGEGKRRKKLGWPALKLQREHPARETIILSSCKPRSQTSIRWEVSLFCFKVIRHSNLKSFPNQETVKGAFGMQTPSESPLESPILNWPLAVLPPVWKVQHISSVCSQ